MRKVTLFIAMSLDGYIADNNGKVDWIQGHEDDTENADSYSEFIKEIDTVIMGWNTYNQTVTELSPDEWVYDELESYVFTHRKGSSSKNITFTDKSPAELTKMLKHKEGKGIWICGGANLIHQLINAQVIDRYYITVIPTVLGGGIKLFENINHEIKLRLTDTHSYNGMVDLIYINR